ncbi:hypothetical protein E8E11_000677 [Didymella keratinophila]|nr:hypothetical protein E8E11_000677 [Didymella keratinophila]
MLKASIVSIYDHTKTLQGLLGPDTKLDTDTLSLGYGMINNKVYTGIIADNGNKVVLRGKWASNRSEATVLFIEVVLNTSARYQNEFLRQMEEMAGREGYTHVPQRFSYNDVSIRFRIMTLISQHMPNARPDRLTVVVAYVCGTLTRMHRTEQLGPRGIQSTEDVSIGIEYDKTECYMGMKISKKMDMKAEDGIEELRTRFATAINRKYEEVHDVNMTQRRR